MVPDLLIIGHISNLFSISNQGNVGIMPSVGIAINRNVKRLKYKTNYLNFKSVSQLGVLPKSAVSETLKV